MPDTIEIEAVNREPQTMALERRQPQELAPTGLFGAVEPAQVVTKAAAVATALRDVIAKQGLISSISGKKYPKCEAWTLLGTMLGVFPVLVWTKPVEGGWEARVEARTRDGSIVGAAEAQCLRSENNWKNRDDFALRSMAQTRATAKCLRMPLGFVMTLAGYEVTPAEEMATDYPQQRSKTPQDKKQGVNTPPPASKPQPPPAAAQSARQTAPTTRPAITCGNEKTLAWMIRELGGDEPGALEVATEYFQALENPAALLPNEPLTSLPLEWVPITRAELAEVKKRVSAFANGDPAVHPYKAHELPEEEKKRRAAKKAASEPKPPPPAVAAAKTKDPEWFFDVICPIPNKGQKRDEYMKKPDTIGNLYLACKAGDEGAGKRLWGFANRYVVSAREHNGKVYQPTEADKVFRTALDAFLEWEKKNGKDTQHTARQDSIEPPGGWQGANDTQAEQDDVPF